LNSRKKDKYEEVVTVGTKASIISAIDKQRESNLIVSVVDSDALGDFPDTTAAEAIRRLSGITVEPEFYYWGTSDRLSQYDLYGTTYSVGIRYNL
jgi:hypothetical protein